MRSGAGLSLHKSNHRVMVYLALALLVSRLLLVIFAFRLNGHDSDRYIREAVNLAQYGTFSGDGSNPPKPLAHDMPGFALIMAGLILVFKNLWLATRSVSALNALAFAITGIGVYRALLLVGSSQRIAAWGIALFGIFPESLPYSVFQMPESMFMAVFLASSIFAAQFLIDARPGLLISAFALLGVSVMLKPVSLFFAPVVVAVACFRYRRQRRHYRALAIGLLFGLLGEAAVCGPWLMRNYIRFGSVSFTTLTGTNLFFYHYRYMLLDKGLPPETVTSIMSSQYKKISEQTPDFESNIMIQAHAIQKFAVHQILADPLAYAWTLIKRYPGLYGGTGTLDLIDMMAHVPRGPSDPVSKVYANHPALWPLRVILSALLLSLYGLIIYGAIRLIKQRYWAPLLFTIIPILYFSAMFGPITASRYRFVMTPFLAMLAAFGICRKDGVTSAMNPGAGSQTPS
jgi:hypothetical protein